MTKVLVVGDVMLDEFCFGDVTRISPESASPVLSATHTDRMIGGAGNVARGIVALGHTCDLVGVVGSDPACNALIKEVRALEPGITPWLACDMARATTHKMRFVSEQHSSHLLRVDAECTIPISGNIEQVVLRHALAALKDADVLVLSDYCKGVVTERIAHDLIEATDEREIPVIVDSKRADLARFFGAQYVKLNLAELGVGANCRDEGLIEREAENLANIGNIGTVIVTRGEDGLSAYGSGKPVHIPGRRVRVRDVSGAGDTIVAALAIHLGGECNFKAALEFANKAASIAVGKPGTAAVTMAELAGSKVAGFDWALVGQRLAEWRGQRIGFTNGCFDLLHPGHVKLLEHARASCDRLIVGVNSDDSVRRLKGIGRPVQSERDRAEVLAALDSVDLVVIFRDDTPVELIEYIKPDVLVKGGDYQPNEIVGREHAGTVIIIDREPGSPSTTAVVERVRKVCLRTRCDQHCELDHKDAGLTEEARRSLRSCMSDEDIRAVEIEIESDCSSVVTGRLPDEEKISLRTAAEIEAERLAAKKNTI